MNIYLLLNLEDPSIDEVHSMVICADDEESARLLANYGHTEEGTNNYWDEGPIWEDLSKTSCQLLAKYAEDSTTRIIQKSVG